MCGCRCSSAGAYDGAAFLKSFPQPNYDKKTTTLDDDTGYVSKKLQPNMSPCLHGCIHPLWDMLRHVASGAAVAEGR